MVVYWPREHARFYALLGFLAIVSIIRFIQEQPPPQEYQGFWEPQIRKFEVRDMTNMPPKGAVLLVGSSSIRLWNTRKQDVSPHVVVKRGFGGSFISDVAHFADRIVLPYEPKVVILYAGDNDVAAFKSNEKILKDFQNLVGIIHDARPETRIAFLSIKPSLVRWKFREKIKRVNSAIRNYSKATARVDYIDIFKPMLNPKGKPNHELFMQDGLHMNAKGYEIWTRAIKDYLGVTTEIVSSQ